MRDKRIVGLSIIIGAIFLFLLLRVAFLQFWMGGEYYSLARRNYIKPDIIEAPRGVIYSRDSVILADNVPSYTIEIDSGLVSEEELEKIDILFANRLERYKVRNAPFSTVCKIEERREDFPSINIRLTPLRRYPYGEGLSHLIGYTAEASRNELLNLKGYRLGASIGKAGIEKEYERFLRGLDGARYIAVDAKGQKIDLLSEISPILGSDVWLNIVAGLQDLAYSILPERGVCLAMDPRNGEVLVWVSKPGFDPHQFLQGISYQEWEKLVKDTIGAPLLNRGLNRYPPASVFKLVTCAVGIEKGVINSGMRQPVACGGGMMIGRREFKCWETHGSLNLIGAIVQSCNVYFYQVGMTIGVDAIHEKTKECGLLDKTGVDLPNERAGFVPNEKWYDNRYGKGRWGKGVAANLSVGQGEIEITPIQLLYFIGGIATGYMYTPRIVSKIVSSEGKVIYSAIPERRELKISSVALEVIREGMVRVVEDGDGTGRHSSVAGVRVAGKTGTAQTSMGKTHAWFVAFAPYDNPEICIVVLAEHGGMGGSVAAPVAKKIIAKYFEVENGTNALPLIYEDKITDDNL